MAHYSEVELNLFRVIIYVGILLTANSIVARAESQAVILEEKNSGKIAALLKGSIFLDPSQSINLYELSSSQEKSLPALSHLKLFENNKRWKECTDIAPKAFRQNKELRGWVMVSWLNCSLKFNESQNKPAKILGPAMLQLQKNIALLDRGPWRQALISLWLRSLQLNIDQNSEMAESAIEWAFLRPEILSTEIKNSYFEKLQKVNPLPINGMKKNFTNASSFADPETEIHASLESLWEQRKRDKKEEIIYEPIADKIGENIVAYLNTYPSGRFQKLWKDRLTDFYNSLWDSKSPTAKTVMTQIQKLESSKLVDLAQNFHRRANYQDALTLCELALQQGINSTLLLWIAARSSLFIGQYEKAKDYYQSLVEKHSGSEEFPENLFRLGLLHYRLGNPQLAVIYFERLLSSGKDKGELNTRYWYLRSLQGIESDKAGMERDAIIEDYPFSYYGLKLAAEKNENVIAFAPKALPTLPSRMTLSGESVQTWNRATRLLKAGLWMEAGQEVNELPWTQNPVLQLTWARWLAKQRQWPPAIRLVNQAFENNPSLKNWDLMQEFFPQDYASVIKMEGEKRGIHPRLIQSLIRQESAFGIRAVSTSNALGLMQMIPPTAMDVARQMKMTLSLPEDMYSPLINIPMGVFYVAQMVDEFKGHIPLALASYNAGPTRMKLWLAGRPETRNLTSAFSTEPRDEIWIDELPWNETSFYVKSILRNVLLYQLREEKTLSLKPAFWSELTSKNVKIQ